MSPAPIFHNVVLFETNNDIMLYFIYLSARTEKEKKEIIIASTSKNKAYYIKRGSISIAQQLFFENPNLWEEKYRHRFLSGIK